jgi:hypothetical protein
VNAWTERANINRYRMLLTTETDELKRQTILKLLAETEARAMSYKSSARAGILNF